MTLFCVENPGEWMAKGFRRCFWGVLLLAFHINLGSIPILPDFVGYLFLISGVNCLRERAVAPGLRRAGIYGRILCFLSVLELFSPFFLPSNLAAIPFALPLVYGAAAACLHLAFVFEVLNVSSQILALDRFPMHAKANSRRLRLYMTAYLLVQMGVLVCRLSQKADFFFVLAGAGLFVQLYLLDTFSRLRRWYYGFTPAGPIRFTEAGPLG